MKRPSFQFYPSDWLRDTALRTCSTGARGLWIDMICFMHEGNPYGHLKVKNKVITKEILARMVGGDAEAISGYVDELVESGVAAIAEDGAYYSRRMVKDELARASRAEGGHKGGNPALGVNYNYEGFVYIMSRADGTHKIGISQHPDKRAYKLRKAMSDESIKVIAKKWVTDMGSTEADLHRKYERYKHLGEWFKFPPEVLEEVVNWFLHLKERQTPSSSSSSSSSLFSFSDSTESAPPPKATRARHVSQDSIQWTRETKWSGITEQDRSDWKAAFPACDIDRQLASMDAWLAANPAKAKKSNWRKFVTTWLTKSQDRGGDIASNKPRVNGCL